MALFGSDFRFSVRQLAKHRAYTATAILSMALGIGATAAVFSVLYGVLIDPYPYVDARRIAYITVRWQGEGSGGNRNLTLEQLNRVRRLKSVEDAMVNESLNMIATDGDVPQTVKVLRATSNLFTFLGAPPMLGRTYTLAEAPPGQEPQPIAVISYLFWKNHFGARPDIVGKTVELNRHKLTVVGVVGPRFTWTDAEVYLPFPSHTDPTKSYQALIRLRKSVSKASAEGELQSFVAEISRENPKLYPRTSFQVKLETLNDWLLGQFKGTLVLLFVAVGLLLLIGCGNVSILMLARGTARQQELAMRAALGASRARIVGQLLTEAVLLSVAGGLLGMGLAYCGVQLIVGLMPEYAIPHEVVIAINPPVLLFSTAVSVACGILFGLSPAFQFSRPQVAYMISGGNRVTSVRGVRTRAVLIGMQVALTMLLLTGAGAAMRSFAEAYTAKLRFDPHQVAIFDFTVPEGKYQTWASRAAYYDQALEQMQSVTGVTSASFSMESPIRSWIQNVDIMGINPDPGRRCALQLASAGYFQTFRIPLKRGRMYTRAEVLRGARVALINETFAKRYFPDEDAIGHLVRPQDFEQPYTDVLFPPNSGQPLQIIGVVSDTKNDGVQRAVLPEIYAPFTLVMPWGQQATVRTVSSPLRFTHAIAESLRKLNDTQAISQVMTFDFYLSAFVWARERFISVLFSVFSIVALGLAAIGLFSNVSYSVAQRTRELGIRTALGAHRRHILATTLAATGKSSFAGLAIGLAASVLLSDTITRWANSTTRDVTTLALVTLVLLLVSTAACMLPALRALRIDPMQALRTD